MTPSAKYEVVSDADAAYAYINTFFELPWSSNQKGIVQKRNGVVCGAVLYVDFNGSNVWVHVAGSLGRGWITREAIHWVFHYPFIQLGCKRITGWVESTNTNAIRFNEHIGFKKEATLAHAGREGQDVYIYGMLREDCKYV